MASQARHRSRCSANSTAWQATAVLPGHACSRARRRDRLPRWARITGAGSKCGECGRLAWRETLRAAQAQGAASTCSRRRERAADTEGSGLAKGYMVRARGQASSMRSPNGGRRGPRAVAARRGYSRTDERRNARVAGLPRVKSPNSRWKRSQPLDYPYTVDVIG